MIQPLLEAERALTVGLLDQAERLYRLVADADPHNSIAVVGLARVAVERGDDRAALELARRAAAIDPENPAASGMVARLEEILGEGRTTPAAITPSDAEAAVAGSEPASPAAGPTVPPPSTRPAPAPTTARRPRRRRSLLDRLLRRG